MHLKQLYADKSKVFHAVKRIFSNKKYTIISRGNLCIIQNSTQRYFYPPISTVRDFELVGDTLFMMLPQLIAKQSMNELTSVKPSDFTIIKNEGGKSMTYDSLSHIFYFALSNGVFSFDSQSDWKEVTRSGKKIYANEVEFYNGILWIATISDGVYGYESDALKYIYNTSNILDANDVRHIKAFRDQVYFTTGAYLYSVDYKGNIVKKFGEYNSVFTKEINNLEIADSRVYLATNKGLVFFPTNMTSVNPVSPNLKIESFTVEDKLFDFNQEIGLGYSARNIRVQFISTSFRSKGTFTYQYRLYGLDTNWVEISANNPSIYFTRLPVGSYQLEIRAVNENKIASNTVIIIILVDSPYWQKWWFWLIYLVGIVALIFIFFDARIKFVKRRADLKNQLAISQLTALSTRKSVFPHS